MLDLKKLAFSDQILSSPRRKVVSPVGLGILLSFIVLSVVVFNVSTKGRNWDQVIQGLNRFGSRGNNSDSSLLSWPFSGGPGVSDHEKTLVANSGGSNKSADLGNSDEEKRNVSVGLGNGTAVVKKNETLSVVGEDKGVWDCLENDTSCRSKVGVSKNGNVSEKGDLSPNGTKVFGVSENVSEKGDLSCNGTKGIGSSENVSKKGDLSRNGTKGSGVSGSGSRSFKDCDIYNGRWVKDDSKPYYPEGSCPFIDKDFECAANGRKEAGYVKWRWQPNDCDIPRLNVTDFLERLRGKKLVFVGDSLNRNMWESLVCVLRHGVEDKKRVFEISGKHEFKKKGFYAFRFEDYNCSVDFVSSPFLVKESSFNGKNGSFETLRLDLMDMTTSMYHDADVLIFNTGHWWTHEKTSRGEDYYQEGDIVHPRLKVLEAFKRALRTWGGWVDKNIDSNKTEVIFRGYSLTHFRGGPWNLGGQCNNETEPIFNDIYLDKYPLKMRVLEYVMKDMKTPVTYLNISRLTDYRKDAHPSIYRPNYNPKEMQTQDCSHWCLPGVPDTWNELLYVSLLKSGRGSWRY